MREELKKLIEDEQSDLFSYESSNFEYSIEDEKEKIIEENYDFGVGLRVFKKNEISLVWTRDKRDVFSLKERVNKNFFKNPGWYIVPPEKNYPEISLYDEEGLGRNKDFYFSIIDEVIRKAKREKLIKKVLNAGFEINEFSVNLLNSYGMDLEAKKTIFSFGLMLVGEKDGEVEVGGDVDIKVFLKEIDVERILEKAIEDTVDKFNAKPIPTGKYNVVFSPKASVSFLSLISLWFRGDYLEKKLSPLEGKEEKKIFSEKISIVNDGLIEKGAGSFPFDAEGIRKKKKYLVKEGIFLDFLYDLRRAKRFSKTSDGVAARSFDSNPSVSFDNFYIEGGKEKKEEIFEGEFIFINEIMGLHLVDPVNLSFSFGARGIYYKNGKKKNSIRGVTISGNFFEFFRNVVGLSSEVEFYGNLGSPYLKVKDLWIAG